MYDETIVREVDIDVPADAVFKFLTDPNKIPLVMPGLVENTAIPELPLKVGSKFHYKYQMYGVILDGDWVVKRMEEPHHYEAETDGDVSSHFVYEISDRDGGSHLKTTISYKTPESVLAKVRADVMRKINEKEADLLMHNLKTVIEMQHE